MIDIEAALYRKVKSILCEWKEESIYAISFFVEFNEGNQYREFSNLSEFAISYNTEKDCGGAGELSEERWNYAFWTQNETPVIDFSQENEDADMLLAWYEEQGISDLGEESEEQYDGKSRYIGKGPAGHYELLTIAAHVGRKLQMEHVLLNQFGKPTPIIVHGLEYAWYDFEATKTANPNGEADVFLSAMRKIGFAEE